MMDQTQSNRIFNLTMTFKDPLQNKLFTLFKGPIEHALDFPKMNRLYDDVSRLHDNRPFPDKVLDQLGVTYDIPEADLSRAMIPKGPVIVVANHPFGGVETAVLASILRSMRCDVKFMANYLLAAIPEIRDLLITVNPFPGRTSVRDNIKPVRESIQWVKDGGMLVVFPAGAVSHFDAKKGVITDPAWNPGIARIVRKTGAPVLPVFFQGTNSAVFHMAGMVHPLLRTAMLPKELFNKDRKKIQVRVGDLLSTTKLRTFDRDEDLTAYLRLRTYLLEHRADSAASAAFIQKARNRNFNEVLPPRNPDVMAEELRRLPPSQTLVLSNELAVLQATTDQIPHVLLEIGRLRELTFRAVGEGTGKAVDIDRFDHSYTHLFIWNREKKEVVGAYRLGKTDELIRRKGARGLYTSTLFRYHPRFFELLGPALEMGRSFIRPEYQKSFTPLLLLWKGIGRYVVENPRYKTLFGPVSISDEYRELSKRILVNYLKTARYRGDMARFVEPRNKLPVKPLKGWDIEAVVGLLKGDVENVSELIACVEPDRKGVPVLLRQYLRLGGELAGFNVDDAFGKVVDGLIIVDLTKTEPRTLDRYLGRDGARRFLAYHDGLHRERHAARA
jgi:putative hemolysin